MSVVKRVQLDLPEKALGRLQDLKERTEATSYAEVVKNALRLYEAVIAEADAGNSFVVRAPSGEMKEYVVF
jgi:Arc/MetJ-type ribon-helix-helix transcriptional regulator